MTPWISREEREPPKDGTRIIAIYKDGWLVERLNPELLRWREYERSSLCGWVRTDGTLMGGNFTHWMPVPPLPEEKKR